MTPSPAFVTARHPGLFAILGGGIRQADSLWAALKVVTNEAGMLLMAKEMGK